MRGIATRKQIHRKVAANKTGRPGHKNRLAVQIDVGIDHAYLSPRLLNGNMITLFRLSNISKMNYLALLRSLGKRKQAIKRSQPMAEDQIRLQKAENS